MKQRKAARTYPEVPKCPYCGRQMVIEPCLNNSWVVYCPKPKLRDGKEHGWFERVSRAKAVNAARRRSK